ncbi:MAG: 2Fe-2S iron-sulfur cluster-binding protein [Geminicoccaceae bacterium]
MAYLHVTDRSGTTHHLEGVEGWRVMELLRDYDTGVDGICGGQCDCASCHVYVDPKWVERLHPKRAEEDEKLDELPLADPTSRLSCQLIWSDDLDGLTLSIAPD